MFKSSTCYGRTCRLLVKAKPNAFSGEKENAKVKIHLCGGVETGASAKQTSWPCPCYRFCSKL